MLRYALEAIARVAADGHEAFPGAFGENLTVEGLDWASLREGDTFEVGDDGLLLELSGPTAPCRNNARWFTDGDFSRISIKHHPADSRWYARVLLEGAVRAGDEVRFEREALPNADDRVGVGGTEYRADDVVAEFVYRGRAVVPEVVSPRV
mgnify:CR=1 FL=1